MLQKMSGNTQTIKAEMPKGKHQIPTKHGTIDDTGFALNLEIKKGASIMCIDNVKYNSLIIEGGDYSLLCMYIKMPLS